MANCTQKTLHVRFGFNDDLALIGVLVAFAVCFVEVVLGADRACILTVPSYLKLTLPDLLNNWLPVFFSLQVTFMHNLSSEILRFV